MGRNFPSRGIRHRFDVWRDGAYAVWLEGKRFENVAADRGKRPWTGINRR